MIGRPDSRVEVERQLVELILAAHPGEDPQQGRLREAGACAVSLVHVTIPAAADSARAVLTHYLEEYAKAPSRHGSLALDEARHLRQMSEWQLHRAERLVDLLEQVHVEADLRDLERRKREREESPR